MKKVVITGGTGFIGLSLAKCLKSNGYHPVLIARSKPKEDFDFIEWDAVNIGAWCESLNDAVAIVNLAGRTVDCIKTPENCDVILRSRVDSTKVIGEALRMIERPPKVWVQMSTAHIYGDPPSQVCNEESSIGYGLAPFVGLAWEEAFLNAIPEGMRGVRLRTGFVIGKNGGALASLKRIVRLGLGGKVGHGNQGMSWIHEKDMNAIMLQAIANEKYSGVYVVSAPKPVSNDEFMKTLRSKMNIKVGLRAPLFLTKLGAKYLFNTDPELVIYGRYVKSNRLEKGGFKFSYPVLSSALEDLVS